jgi:hypothetical protein
VLIEELEILMEEAERNKCYYWNEELEILVEEVESFSTSSTRISIYSSLLPPQESLFTLLYFRHNNLYLFFSTRK